MSDQQHHHHPHGQGHDYVEANKAYFNASGYAASYDDHPSYVEFAKAVGAAIRDAYPFDPETTTALDFACGTGLTTRSYVPYVKSVLGVDISQRMLDQYTKQAIEKGFADKMSCICTELKGAEGELDGAQFDVITCSMAYHHFGSTQDITNMLAKFLRPGGVLIIIDIEAPSEQTKALKEMENLEYVAHKRGFETEDMRKLFEGAGLVAFDMKHVTHAKLVTVGGTGDLEIDAFLAKGAKPAESIYY
ncbi:hypothetical protein GYMLUDRAFT_227463 [Collybiopsis luxurians FD-317 M1]|uniref:Methyltransferase domain-containing protein n=1 Tax=Collybiopsis luxurians FD-317 M1 TaxID=944289 RepID=A0A0D0CKT3_9AGAR|nr:hypothetical protein GYMLUDRAFT_227463 [Collybiopsis luxurians FD-317 M1]